MSSIEHLIQNIWYLISIGNTEQQPDNRTANMGRILNVDPEIIRLDIREAHAAQYQHQHRNPFGYDFFSGKRMMWVRPIERLKLNFGSCVICQTRPSGALAMVVSCCLYIYIQNRTPLNYSTAAAVVVLVSQWSSTDQTLQQKTVRAYRTTYDILRCDWSVFLIELTRPSISLVQ